MSKPAIMLLLSLLFILPIFSQLDSIRFNNGIKFFKAEDYENAKNIFLEILDNNELSEAHYYLAWCYFILGDLDKAIDHGKIAVELDDNNADYHFNLGRLYAEDARDASIFRAPFIAGDIKEQFERTIELEPDHIDGRIGLAQFYLRAPGIAGGDIDKALEQANIVTGMDKRRGNFLLFQIFNYQDNYEKAEEKLKFLEENYGNDPDFFYLYNNYGYFLLNQSRVDEAIQKFRKQVELAPERSNPHDSLGEALRVKGLLPEALAEYEKAVEISPDLERAKEIIEEIKQEIKEG